MQKFREYSAHVFLSSFWKVKFDFMKLAPVFVITVTLILYIFCCAIVHWVRRERNVYVEKTVLKHFPSHNLNAKSDESFKQQFHGGGKMNEANKKRSTNTTEQRKENNKQTI